jgi:hypothetical protein
MRSRIVLVAAAAVALALAGLLLSRLLRTPPADEERIRALILAAARAAEERHAGDVVRAVSERFQGEGLDRQGLHQFVAYQILRGDWVSVSVAGARVEVTGDGARAAADVVLARSGQGTRLADVLPESGSLHRLQLRLEREGNEWKVVRARWRPITTQEAAGEPVLDPDGLL